MRPSRPAAPCQAPGTPGGHSLPLGSAASTSRTQVPRPTRPPRQLPLPPAFLVLAGFCLPLHRHFSGLSRGRRTCACPTRVLKSLALLSVPVTAGGGASSSGTAPGSPGDLPGASERFQARPPGRPASGTTTGPSPGATFSFCLDELRLDAGSWPLTPLHGTVAERPNHNCPRPQGRTRVTEVSVEAPSFLGPRRPGRCKRHGSRGSGRPAAPWPGRSWGLEVTFLLAHTVPVMGAEKTEPARLGCRPRPFLRRIPPLQCHATRPAPPGG